MKVATTFAVSLVTIVLLFSCKKSTEPVIPGWEVLSIGTNADLFAVDFVDENYGWMIGRDTVVFHTTDGGNTWVRQSYPNYQLLGLPLRDIQCIDQQLGWAVGGGYNGFICKTTDGGNNWFIQDTVKRRSVNCIFFTDPSHGWVCGGSSAGFLRTADGGDTWDSISSPYVIYLRDFVDSLNGWAFGQGGSILHTADGGLTWVNMFPEHVDSCLLDFVDLYHGWGLIVSRVSEYEQWFWVIHTTDGGHSWEPQLSIFNNQDGNSAIGPLMMLNQNTGWIGKWESRKASVLHTTDGGKSWLDQPLPFIGDKSIADMEFINEKVGWAVGTGGLLLRTKNGGNPIR